MLDNIFKITSIQTYVKVNKTISMSFAYNVHAHTSRTLKYAQNVLCNITLARLLNLRCDTAEFYIYNTRCNILDRESCIPCAKFKHFLIGLQLKIFFSRWCKKLTGNVWPTNLKVLKFNRILTPSLNFITSKINMQLLTTQLYWRKWHIHKSINCRDIPHKRESHLFIIHTK